MSSESEPQAVVARYARRAALNRYSVLAPDVWQTMQERQRAMLGLFRELGWTDLSALQVLEVGCGAGGNLLELLRLGVAPHRLRGVELLPERWQQARAVLPESVLVDQGDALQLKLAAQSQDIVFVSTVFSSLLDDAFQRQLAAVMWSWVKPGGGVLWYDFSVDNPRNPDVRGVPLAHLRQLFPEACPRVRRVTLAPPIARAVVRIHPALYTLFNTLPLLRTHLLAWLPKP
jgi:SAM-dependent methyltransferase